MTGLPALACLLIERAAEVRCNNVNVALCPNVRAPAAVLLALLVGLLPCSAAGTYPVRTAVATLPSSASSTNTASPLARLVVIGASASAGFTESEPFGGPITPQYRLSRYLDAAVRARHEPVRNLATTFFFLQPEREGQRQLQLAAQSHPTLLVGLDFLFWFCYGDGPTDAARLQRFANGLKLLETVSCPLVLGDLPDASGAAERMLGPEQMPGPAALAEANRHLNAWAARRKNVSILPLSKFMRSAAAGGALTVHGRTWPAGQTRGFLQDDQLHPTASGSAVLALAVLDTFCTTRSPVAANIRWDFEDVLRRGLDSVPPSPPPKQQQNGTADRREIPKR